MSPSPTISRHQADRHEALFPRLASLTKELQVRAARRPLAPVPEPMRLEAEGLLYQSGPFRLGRSRSGLACVAPHCGALAAQLGTALAELVGFEARHTRWDAELRGPVWLVEGAVLPVRRLQPKGRRAAPLDTKAAQAKAADKARMLELRERLILRIDQFKRRTTIEARPEPDTPPAS